MLSVLGILRKLPLSICISWGVYFSLLQFKVCRDITIRKAHLVKSMILWILSLVAGIIGWLWKFSMLLETAIMCFILASVEYCYLKIE